MTYTKEDLERMKRSLGIENTDNNTTVHTTTKDSDSLRKIVNITPSGLDRGVAFFLPEDLEDAAVSEIAKCAINHAEDYCSPEDFDYHKKYIQAMQEYKRVAFKIYYEGEELNSQTKAAPLFKKTVVPDDFDDVLHEYNSLTLRIEPHYGFL